MNSTATNCSRCSIGAGQGIPLQCVAKEICIKDKERGNLADNSANWEMGAPLEGSCVIVVISKKQLIWKFTDYNLFIVESASNYRTALVDLLSFFSSLPWEHF